MNSDKTVVSLKRHQIIPSDFDTNDAEDEVSVRAASSLDKWFGVNK
jgi:hypothetical protein